MANPKSQGLTLERESSDFILGDQGRQESVIEPGYVRAPRDMKPPTPIEWGRGDSLLWEQRREDVDKTTPLAGYGRDKDLFADAVATISPTQTSTNFAFPPTSTAGGKSTVGPAGTFGQPRAGAVSGSTFASIVARGTHAGATGNAAATGGTTPPASSAAAPLIQESAFGAINRSPGAGSGGMFQTHHQQHGSRGNQGHPVQPQHHQHQQHQLSFTVTKTTEPPAGVRYPAAGSRIAGHGGNLAPYRGEDPITRQRTSEVELAAQFRTQSQVLTDELHHQCKTFPPPPPIIAPGESRRQRAARWYYFATKWDITHEQPPPPRSPLPLMDQESENPVIGRDGPAYPYRGDYWLDRCAYWYNHIQETFPYPGYASSQSVVAVDPKIVWEFAITTGPSKEPSA
jgi:hypothetical protein